MWLFVVWCGLDGKAEGICPSTCLSPIERGLHPDVARRVDGLWVAVTGRIAELIFEIWDLADAHVAQSVERVLGKDEVISSILIMGSSNIK